MKVSYIFPWNKNIRSDTSVCMMNVVTFFFSSSGDWNKCSWHQSQQEKLKMWKYRSHTYALMHGRRQQEITKNSPDNKIKQNWYIVSYSLYIPINSVLFIVDLYRLFGVKIHIKRNRYFLRPTYFLIKTL